MTRQARAGLIQRFKIFAGEVAHLRERGIHGRTGMALAAYEFVAPQASRAAEDGRA